MLNVDKTLLVIKEFEGYSPFLYKDTEGFYTIGYGYNIEKRGLPHDICEELLKRDVENIIDWCKRKLPWFEKLNEARKIAIISMVYQLGKRGFLSFKKMIAAIEAGDWYTAYREALDSKWAKQTPHRAKQTALALLHGDEAFLHY